MSFIVAPNGTAFDKDRWGLNMRAIEDLATELRRVWSRFSHIFKPQSGPNKSEYAFVYLRALLTMERNRNYAEISRRLMSITNDGQCLQQFISDSPWDAKAMFRQIQEEIKKYPQLHGGTLTLDESGDRRSGENSAGASRQYLGNLGKVDRSQVGVALGYYQARIWTMVDAELYLPLNWFDAGHATLRERWHIPTERVFQTKPQIGLKMIKQAKEHQLPFRVVLCDSVYGCDTEFRFVLNDDQILYVADVHMNTPVYLSRPEVGIPETPEGRRGRPFSKHQILSPDEPVEPRSLIGQLLLQPIVLRYTERELLLVECAARRVWTVGEDGKILEEWLLIRKEADGKFKCSLSNAPVTTDLEQLAHWRCERYFVERTFQDAKSELGWDELEARKYRSWMHHSALTALALWFVSETKLLWSIKHPRDPLLATELDIRLLPSLSTANIREMLKAVLPLPVLSVAQATQVVVKHLVARSRSTRCRLRQDRRRWQTLRI